MTRPNLAERYGPWAVVAGASEGTGRSIARQLAAAGIPSVLIARREGPLHDLVTEIREESGVECLPAAIDLAAADASDRIIDAVGQRDVGLFVSNAGSDPNGARFLDRDADTWLELVNRNVLTTLRCCHHFGGLMREQGRGGLLLVNSGACYGGASFMATYSASKAFLLNFGESLWSELRPHGVDVLNLILGRTDTPAFRQLLADKGMPVPEDLASPEEVARVALERLGKGPVHIWGQADDEAGQAPASASTRRARIEAIDAATASVFGSNER